SAIERCRFDYQIERVHLEANHVLQLFGQCSSSNEAARETQIAQFLRKHFARLLVAQASSPAGSPGVPPGAPSSTTHHPSSLPRYRLGFDVPASGEGDLAAYYID